MHRIFKHKRKIFFAYFTLKLDSKSRFLAYNIPYNFIHYYISNIIYYTTPTD